MTNFFISCLMIMPWLFLPLKISEPFRGPKATFFDLMCLGMISLAFYYGFRFTYKNKLLFWFSMWVFITCFFNWFLPFTLTFNNQTQINIVTIEPMIHFILGLFMTLIALSYFTKEDYTRIARFLCISATLVSAFAMLQIVGLDPLGKLVKDYNHDNHFYALMDNPNIVGNYLCLILPFFFLFIKDLKYKAMFVITLLGVILSKSAWSYISGISGLLIVFILFYRSEKHIIYKLVLVLLGFLYLFIQFFNLLKWSFSSRIACWTAVLPHLKENPLFGQGLGVFKTWNILTPITSTSRWLTAHNDWLQLSCEIGILGVFLLVLVAFRSIKNFNYKQDNKVGFVYLASFVSFLVLMCASFPLEIAPVALIGLLGFWGTEKL